MLPYCVGMWNHPRYVDLLKTVDRIEFGKDRSIGLSSLLTYQHFMRETQRDKNIEFYIYGVPSKTRIKYVIPSERRVVMLHTHEILFWVRSLPNVDGFCSNIARFGKPNLIDLPNNFL